MKSKIFALFLIFLFTFCKDKAHKSDDAEITALYLPDLDLLYPDYESVDSTKAYAKLANKLIRENRDLQSSQMYIDAAWFYNKAGYVDSVAIMLHRAIDRGMANPKILQKFSILDTIPDSPIWNRLEITPGFHSE